MMSKGSQCYVISGVYSQTAGKCLRSITFTFECKIGRRCSKISIHSALIDFLPIWRKFTIRKLNHCFHHSFQHRFHLSMDRFVLPIRITCISFFRHQTIFINNSHDIVIFRTLTECSGSLPAYVILSPFQIPGTGNVHLT